MSLVKGERLARLLFLVVLVLFLDLLEVGLKRSGALGHQGLLAAQREHHQLDQQSQQDDRDPIVALGLPKRCATHSVTW